METLTRTPASDRLRHALGDVVSWERARGVLTLTMAADDLGRPRSVAAAEVERGLDELERRRTARRSVHVARTLRADIETRSTRSGGAGLAAVADLHTGRIVRLPAVGPLPTRLRVGCRAELRPLVRALRETTPTGVVRASAAAVEIGELGAPGLEWIVALRLPGQHGRDPDDPARHALAGQAADRVASEADERRWDTILLVGGGELAASLAEALPDAPGVLVVDTMPSDATDAADAAVREALRDARRRRASARLATARSLALRGGHAVLGAEATIEALEAGRVAVLLLPVDAPIPGLVSADGTMTALRRGGPTSHAADPQLADAMIRAALAQHAEIELVDELEHGEAAALLRW